MGFMDNISSKLNQGKESVVRSSRSVQVKYQLNDLLKQREDYMAQLGASIYDEVKGRPEFRRGREQLFNSIAELDVQRAELEAEAAQLEQDAVDAQTFSCPNCGATIKPTDLFCRSCGASVSEMRGHAPEPGRICASCGAPLQEGDLFCTKCGAKVE